MAGLKVYELTTQSTIIGTDWLVIQKGVDPAKKVALSAVGLNFSSIGIGGTTVIDASRNINAANVVASGSGSFGGDLTSEYSGYPAIKVYGTLGALISLNSSTSEADLKRFEIINNAGSTRFRTLTDVGALKSNVLTINHSTNEVTFAGNIATSGTVTANKLNLTNLPTSATGLTSGDVWRDGTDLKIVI